MEKKQIILLSKATKTQETVSGFSIVSGTGNQTGLAVISKSPGVV